MTVYKGIKLFPKQQEIANAIVNTPTQKGVVDYHVICCSRQFGKSTLTQMLILYYAINFPGSRNLFCSLTYSQSNKVFNAIINGIKKWNIIEKKDGSENSIILKNGSVIYCRSFTRCDTLRGLSCENVFLDECAYMKDEDFQSVIRPILSTVGQRCVLASTPRGANWYKTMYDKGLSNEFPNYHSYYATYRENPIANISEIEDAKKSLPDKIFRCEYEAEFVSGSLSVFENYRNCIGTYTGTFRNTIAAIDVGRQNDYTCLTIMQSKYVVFQGTWRQEPWEDIINHILENFKKYSVRTCYVEVNGLGDVFFDMLSKALRIKRMGISIEPWTTTNTSKQNIVEQLINDFLTNNIVIPNDEELLLELDNFECEYSNKSHAIKYAAREPFHDDRCMSLSICNYNRVVNAPTGSYMIRSL